MTRRLHTQPAPVLADNSLNRAFAVKYAIYAAFGVSGVITHIPSLAIIAGEAAATILAGVVALTGVLAAISAWNSIAGGVWVRRELYATITLCAFIAMYDIALYILSIVGVGDRINLAIIATALLVMPLWRIRWILKNSRA